MSAENDHARESQRLLVADRDWAVGWGTADAQHIANHLEANTQATLALAYEQRTANLIALWSNPRCAIEDIRGNPMTYSLNDDTLGQILQEISERLGLA